MPRWTSDYTWAAVHDWTARVGVLSTPHSRFVWEVAIRRGSVGLPQLRTSRLPVTDERTPFRWLDTTGEVVASGRAPTILESEGDGRVVLVPEGPAAAVLLEVGGVRQPASAW